MSEESEPSEPDYARMEETDFNEILRLSRLYRREAEKCEEGRAFLAGCVMLGAALEADLIGMVHLYSDEVANSKVAPRQKGRLKKLERWTMNELVLVARELGWLPAGLELEEAWKTRRAKVGDYAVALRQIRNLVHPFQYVSQHPGGRITRRYLDRAWEIVDAAQSYLHDKVIESLRARMDAEDDV